MVTLLPVIKRVLRLIHETLIVSTSYDKYTISSINISCNILYIVICVTANKKPQFMRLGQYRVKITRAVVLEDSQDIAWGEPCVKRSESFLGRFLNLTGEGQVIGCPRRP